MLCRRVRGGRNAPGLALNGGTLEASAGALVWLGDLAATLGSVRPRCDQPRGGVVLIGAAVRLHPVCPSLLHAAVAARRSTCAWVAA